MPSRSVLFLPLIASAALSCGGGSETDSTPSTAGPDGTDWPVRSEQVGETRYDNVVLVTIDTFRADHASCYGYQRRTTPFLDSLADRGAVFERTISSLPFTAPSHTSMLTGLHPEEHGVLHNGLAMPGDAVTAASLFRQAGFETAAFLNVEFLADVANDFDHVSPQPGRESKVVAAVEEYILGIEPGSRQFLWIHLYSPHHWMFLRELEPRFLDEVRASTALSDDELFRYLADLHGMDLERFGDPWDPQLDRTFSGNVSFKIRSQADFLRYVDQYDALIRIADDALERMYRAFHADPERGSTLWLVASDHGEGVLSHMEIGHGNSVFQEQLLVPMVVHASDDSIEPRRVPELTQLVDIFPTFAEAAGFRLEGLDPQLRGRSLWPLLEGEEVDWSERVAFAQRYPTHIRKESFDQEDVRAGTVPAKELMYSLQTEKLKIMRRASGEEAFVDLENDPLELELILEPKTDAMHLLSVELLRKMAQFQRQSDLIFNEERLEELEKLGYVE